MPRKKKTSGNFECPNNYECLESDMETETEASGYASSRPPSSNASRRTTSERQDQMHSRKQLDLLARENDNLRSQLKMSRQSVDALRREIDNLKKVVAQTTLEATNKRKKPITSSSDSDSEDEAMAPKKTAPPTTRPDSPQPSTSEAPAEQPKAASATPAAAQDKPKTAAVPPVVLHAKDQWIAVSKRLAEKGIRYSKAKTIAQGIAITPATTEDHRALTRTFNEEKKEYHTYSLAEDKKLRLVIRGLPVGITPEEVSTDLQEQGFNPISIHRMKAYRTKQPLPMFLVQAPQEETGLLQVNRCCHLVVRVEPQRRRKELAQCHRCQRFGHAQGRCTATPKCVKCGEDHHSAECQKTKETPAKCANCGGDHPANYRGCTKAPKKTRAPAAKEPQQQQTRPATQLAGDRHPSYARAVQPQAAGQPQQSQPQQPGATPQIQMMDMMKDMLTACLTNMLPVLIGKYMDRQ